MNPPQAAARIVVVAHLLPQKSNLKEPPYVHHQIPPKVDYSLTPLGQKLTPILHAMHEWGEAAEKCRPRSRK